MARYRRIWRSVAAFMAAVCAAAGLFAAGAADEGGAPPADLADGAVVTVLIAGAGGGSAGAGSVAGGAGGADLAAGAGAGEGGAPPAITAAVAASPAARARGLSGRRDLAAGAGMLFIFPAGAGAPPCMWMKDTAIPLLAIFADAGGRVLKTAKMRPHSEDLHCAPAGARYVLEIRADALPAPLLPGALLRLK